MLGIKRIKKNISSSLITNRSNHLSDSFNKIPLTERNIETFVTEQIEQDARDQIQRTREIQISEWLRLLPRVRA